MPLFSRISPVYISEYVAFKEGLARKDPFDDSNLFENAEFMSLLSQRKLSYPLAELFELCCILFCYYKNIEKTFINHLLNALNEIYQSCQLKYESYKNILRSFSNCFSKASSNDKSKN